MTSEYCISITATICVTNAKNKHGTTQKQNLMQPSNIDSNFCKKNTSCAMQEFQIKFRL